jgi:hypothetical protein
VVDAEHVFDESWKLAADHVRMSMDALLPSDLGIDHGLAPLAAAGLADDERLYETCPAVSWGACWPSILAARFFGGRMAQ